MISSEKYRPPKDYGDTFTVLAEQGVLDDCAARKGFALATLDEKLKQVCAAAGVDCCA